MSQFFRLNWGFIPWDLLVLRLSRLEKNTRHHQLYWVLSQAGKSANFWEATIAWLNLLLCTSLLWVFVYVITQYFQYHWVTFMLCHGFMVFLLILVVIYLHIYIPSILFFIKIYFDINVFLQNKMIFSTLKGRSLYKQTFDTFLSIFLFLKNKHIHLYTNTIPEGNR